MSLPCWACDLQSPAEPVGEDISRKVGRGEPRPTRKSTAVPGLSTWACFTNVSNGPLSPPVTQRAMARKETVSASREQHARPLPLRRMGPEIAAAAGVGLHGHGVCLQELQSTEIDFIFAFILSLEDKTRLRGSPKATQQWWN